RGEGETVTAAEENMRRSHAANVLQRIHRSEFASHRVPPFSIAETVTLPVIDRTETTTYRDFLSRMITCAVAALPSAWNSRGADQFTLLNLSASGMPVSHSAGICCGADPPVLVESKWAVVEGSMPTMRGMRTVVLPDVPVVGLDAVCSVAKACES